MKAYLPREHGAWGLLFQPFVAGAAVAGQWTWLYVPAIVLALLGFLLKEPLIVVVRQRIVWKRETEETPQAMRWTAILLAGIAICAAAIVAWGRVDWRSFALLVSAGGILTITAVWMTVRNRQRSMTLQIASAAGLGSTALLAALVATGSIPNWAWILWVILTAHAVAAIPVVHVRLELKARKTEAAAATRRWAIAWQIVEAALAIGLIAVGKYELAIPFAFSAIVNWIELRRLAAPDELAVPVKRIGLRLLAISLVHTALAVISVMVAASGSPR